MATKTIKLTPKQQQAMNALQSGAHIRPDGRIFTKAGTYIETLKSSSHVGLIKKRVIRMIERENEYNETERVWVLA